MEYDYYEKKALIIGAISGLGLSYAKYFASKGYDLIITGRRQEVIRKKSKKGLVAFRSPDDIVVDAMKDFEKGIVVSVPDRGAKLIRFMAKFTPRKIFYKKVSTIASSMSSKNNS